MIIQATKLSIRLFVLGVVTFLVSSLEAQLRPHDFDVSDGKIEKAEAHRLMVSTKEMRATLKYRTRQDASLKFTYLGPTREVARLGNGDVRSQFGIKLRAQDTCNVVYVMWHFAPDQKIAVSVKRNPGRRTHEECLDRGYINDIKPYFEVPVQTIHIDEPHTLAASMSGSKLTVTADNRVVWKGDLGSVALEFDGPVGVRSDNAHVVFDFAASR
jgi:hypothetical protein